MLTVTEAISLVAQHTRPLPPVRLPLGQVLGHTLAGDVVSSVDSPPYHKAMMDGFAVAASDRAPERRVIEEVMAGDVPHHAIVPGTATRIMTGAQVPEGATAVVPIEKTEPAGDDSVRLNWTDPPVGAHVMRQGTSMRVGDTVLYAGTVLRPLEVAILAELGHAKVQVVPKPTVAVLTTGNELKATHEQLAPGQIRNSNGPMLVAALSSGGATPVDLGVGRDDLDALTSLIGEGLQSDMLIATGGVSAGDKDLMPAAFERAGVEQVFHKIALKPGKPLWFGIVARDDASPRLVFGLPGNPVSSWVCFRLFVQEAIDVLSGRSSKLALNLNKGQASEPFEHRGGRETFRPAQVTYVAGELPTVAFPRWHGSADLAGMARTNCLVRLPPEPVSIGPGDEVEFVGD